MYELFHGWTECSICLPFADKDYNDDKKYLFYLNDKLYLSSYNDGDTGFFDSMSTAKWIKLPKTPKELEQSMRKQLEKQYLSDEITEKIQKELIQKYDDLNRKVNRRFCWIILFISIYNLARFYLLE